MESRFFFLRNIPLKDLLKDSVLNPGKEIPKWPSEKPGFDKNEQSESICGQSQILMELWKRSGLTWKIMRLTKKPKWSTN